MNQTMLRLAAQGSAFTKAVSKTSRPTPRAANNLGGRSKTLICNVLGRNETKEAAVERRVRESEAVSERVTFVSTVAELDEQIEKVRPN